VFEFPRRRDEKLAAALLTNPGDIVANTTINRSARILKMIGI